MLGFYPAWFLELQLYPRGFSAAASVPGQAVLASHVGHLSAGKNLQTAHLVSSKTHSIFPEMFLLDFLAWLCAGLGMCRLWYLCSGKGRMKVVSSLLSDPNRQNWGQRAHCVSTEPSPGPQLSSGCPSPALTGDLVPTAALSQLLKMQKWSSS